MHFVPRLHYPMSRNYLGYVTQCPEITTVTLPNVQKLPRLRYPMSRNYLGYVTQCPEITSVVSVVSVLQASACNTDTTSTQPHRISNTQRTKNITTNVIQRHSRKLLMMDVLMPETHKKWNKIASDIKLAFYSSTITMKHGPLNIRFRQRIKFSWTWSNTVGVTTS